MRMIFRCLLVWCGLLIWSTFVWSAPSGEVGETVLLNPAPAAGDLFGTQLARSGEWMVIGALNDHLPGDKSGSVTIYRLIDGQWVSQGPLQSNPPAGPDSWFASVSIDGNWLAVGASRQNANIGAVYMFEWDGTAWVQRQKLEPDLPHFTTCTAPGFNRCHLFGGNVSLSGDRLAVGAPTEDELLGSVYVFHREGANWVKEARLRAAGASSGQERSFGNSISLAGDRLVVGESAYDRSGSCGNATRCDQGAAYIFERGLQGWQQVTMLEASDGDESDHFGYAVDVSADRVVVGARLADLPGQAHRGAAYIFEVDGGVWQQTARLDASNGSGSSGEGGDQFGFSVSIDGDHVFVGRFPGNGATADQGRIGEVYHFVQHQNAWIQARRFAPAGLQPGDGYAVRLFLDQQLLLVGASNHQLGGAVFVYDRAQIDQLLKDGFEAP